MYGTFRNGCTHEHSRRSVRYTKKVIKREGETERERERGREGGRERPEIRAVDRSEREIDKRRERVIVRGEGEGGRDEKKETCDQRCRGK